MKKKHKFNNGEGNVQTVDAHFLHLCGVVMASICVDCMVHSFFLLLLIVYATTNLHFPSPYQRISCPLRNSNGDSHGAPSLASSLAGASLQAGQQIMGNGCRVPPPHAKLCGGWAIFFTTSFGLSRSSPPTNLGGWNLRLGRIRRLLDGRSPSFWALLNKVAASQPGFACCEREGLPGAVTEIFSFTLTALPDWSRIRRLILGLVGKTCAVPVDKTAAPWVLYWVAPKQWNGGSMWAWIGALSRSHCVSWSPGSSRYSGNLDRCTSWSAPLGDLKDALGLDDLKLDPSASAGSKVTNCGNQ